MKSECEKCGLSDFSFRRKINADFQLIRCRTCGFDRLIARKPRVSNTTSEAKQQGDKAGYGKTQFEGGNIR